MLPLITARLESTVSALRRVAGAADIAAAEEDLKRMPAAYVLPLRERAGENYLDNAVSQRVARAFGVLYAVRNLRDARGDAAHVHLEELRTEGRAALLGWEPDDDHEPIEFRGGRLLRLTNPILFWQDEYETAHLVRAV